MDLIEIDPADVKRTIERNGYAVAAGCIAPVALEEMHEEFGRAIERLPEYSYPFGEQHRVEAAEMRRAWSSLLPCTASILLQNPIADICAGYGAREERDLVVWSHEFNRDTKAIYGVPHFDRRHQLKVFIYLTDVREHDGPTHVATEAPSQFHARWINAWRDALDIGDASDLEVLEQVRATPEDTPAYRSVSCEVELPRRSFEPLVGDAGTIVFFDTSLAHFGGLVDGAGTRQTVRRHCLLD